MREIKFRVWHTKAELMSDIATIQYIAEMDHAWNLEGAIWLQYTGLKDKNGREIYEGDIVKWREDFVESVSFNPEHAAYETETSMLDSHCEVIGNIYENPELLE